MEDSDRYDRTDCRVGQLEDLVALRLVPLVAAAQMKVQVQALWLELGLEVVVLRVRHVVEVQVEEKLLVEMVGTAVVVDVSQRPHGLHRHQDPHHHSSPCCQIVP